MRFICILLVMLVMQPIANGVCAQFTINGKHLVFNATDSVYMCAISDSLFTNDYIARICSDTLFKIKQFDDTIDSTKYSTTCTIDTTAGVIIDTLVWHSMRLNDSLVNLNDSVIFEDVIGNKVYYLKAYFNNSDSMCFPITFTNLPIVVLQGEFGYDYQNGIVHLFHPDSVGYNSDMLAKIKWRGGTTNGEGKNKRNYTLKFVNEKGKKQKRQFFGLRTNNYWILNAGQVDLSRCRNLICHELWQDMARKPYYIDKAPNAITNSRGTFVEVILNNEYRGLYSMCENVDQEQMQLKKYDEENEVFHGQLWKTDSWDGTGMTDLKNYDNNQETYRGFETKYPDFDDVNPTDYSTLYNAIDFVVNSSDLLFEEKVEDYFDVPILIDYYLFVNVLVARDNCGKNMFWGCYDREMDKKLTIGVWDLDCTIGQNYTDIEPHPDSFGPEVDMRSKQMRVIDRILNIPYYASAVQYRYKELAPIYLNADSLIARFEKYFSFFERGGAATREELRWSGDTDVAGINLDFYSELEFIKKWIKERFNYLNNGEFKGNTSTNVVIYEGEEVRKQIYTILGFPVNKPKNAGVYIQNGRKIIVK